MARAPSFGTPANTLLLSGGQTLSAPLIGIVPRTVVIDANGTNFGTYNNTGTGANTLGVQALATYSVPIINSTTVTGTNTAVTVPTTVGLIAGTPVYGPTVSAGATISSITDRHALRHLGHDHGGRRESVARVRHHALHRRE